MSQDRVRDLARADSAISHTETETETSKRVVSFYERDDELTGRSAAHVAEGLLSGAGAVAVVTARLRPAFEWELVQWGVDLAAARAQDRLILHDAGEVLEEISAAGRPDPAAFESRMVERVGRAARAGHGPVRVFGQVAALTLQAGHVDAAIELEQVGEQLATRR